MTNTAVDTSRPFSSVKEAVAIFGDRIPFKEVRNSPTQDDSPPIFGTPSPWKSPGEVEEQVGIEHVLKKLEAELSEAKEELKLLKKEMKTEVTVAALNDELHRSTSSLAKAEVDAASRRWTGLENGKEQHAVNKGKMEIMSYSLSLAQIPSVGENKQEGEARDRDAARKRMKTTATIKKQQKQKPIVPLVWELFSRRKTSADDPLNLGRFRITSSNI